MDNETGYRVFVRLLVALAVVHYCPYPWLCWASTASTEPYLCSRLVRFSRFLLVILVVSFFVIVFSYLSPTILLQGGTGQYCESQGYPMTQVSNCRAPEDTAGEPLEFLFVFLAGGCLVDTIAWYVMTNFILMHKRRPDNTADRMEGTHQLNDSNQDAVDTEAENDDNNFSCGRFFCLWMVPRYSLMVMYAGSICLAASYKVLIQSESPTADISESKKAALASFSGRLRDNGIISMSLGCVPVLLGCVPVLSFLRRRMIPAVRRYQQSWKQSYLVPAQVDEGRQELHVKAKILMSGEQSMPGEEVTEEESSNATLESTV